MKGLVVSNVPPPLLGFNNNVRHRGRIFHIQTEDSGLKSPRIVTHLFADGGRIIRTTRTDYAEHVARPDVQGFVRSLMKEQHKAMFMALRSGELDAHLEAMCGPFEQPLQRSKPQTDTSSAPPSSDSISESLPIAPRASTPDFETPPLASAFGEEERRTERPEQKPASSQPSLRRITPAGMPSLHALPPVELDVAVTDRAPPPSAAPSGAPEPPFTLPAPSSNPPRKLRPNLPLAAAAAPPGLSRPASRFAAVPSKSSSSIFGDGVLSEQSLDEVILSYLAEDLDGSSE